MSFSSAPRALLVLLVLPIALSGCRQPLEPGSTREVEIAQGEHQRFLLDLEAGLFHHLVVGQETADLVLTLSDPSGERVEVDVDTTPPGQIEHLYLIPHASGRYELDVYALALSADAEPGRGRYTLELRRPRPPSEEDRLVEQAFWAESRALELDAIAEDCVGAIAEYERAAELWDRLDRPQNVALVLLEQGDCHLRLGQAVKAYRQFERVLDLAEVTHDPVQRMHALSALGVTSRALGRLDQAYRYHQQALVAAKEVGEMYHVGRSLNSLCVLYTELGKEEEAEKRCREAIELYDQAGWRLEKIRTLNNLGWAYEQRGEWAEAAQIYRRALDLEPKGTRLSVRILGNLSRIQERLGDLEEARGLLEKALASSIELGQVGSEASYRARLAGLLTTLGEPEAARLEVKKARTLLEEVDSVQVRLGVLTNCARAEWRGGSPEMAVETAESAFGLLEKMRRSPQDFDDRATFLASRWSLYDLRVAIRMSLYEETRDPAWRDAALHAAEEARARGLLDRLQSSRQAGIAVLEPAQIHRRLLDESTGLLLFHLGEEQSFLWRLAHGETAVFVLPSMREIHRAAQPLYRALTEREVQTRGESTRAKALRIGEADAEVWTAGRRLVETLRLEEVLGAGGITRWVVVPDGVLHRVPMEALPWLGEARSGEGRRPLLADLEIVYAPSASSLAALRSTSSRQHAGNDFLALADPVFELTDPRRPDQDREMSGRDQQVLEIAAFSEKLARLPLTRLEVEEIAEIAPAESRVLTGHAASKERLLGEELDRFAYLHLATHGLVNEQDPSRSGLVLSRFDEDGRPIDGYVDLDEVAELEIGARLVVLSACHSATGRELRGEGVLGLARGFLNAGVPRVIASRWTVEDGVTRDLMTSLYGKIWRDGASPSAALREAQLELWRRGLAPYHWAAFSFHGEWR